ncbi:MAG: class I SAM-dependent methyltransferase [Bacteroidetes bacterium]|nr:class I SAM-dependent methyltransferase [Bacteroidota bacterium]
MSTFNIIQLGLILILFAFLIYYVWSIFFGKNYQPLIWKQKAKQNLISKELIKIEGKYKDKDRFFNFWFQVERLRESKIEGSFAELGVYKGDSAAVLHAMDPSREFHLFDTFEGFQQKDLENETGKAATYTTHNFADTSIDRVKQKLTSNKYYFHQGYFPETTKGINNVGFALVNMDVDLYNPTKAGLEYFFPRLSEGGVIIVHDYNPDWLGIMKAVDDFANTIPTPIVPLTDTDSSVMLFKPKGF